MEINRNRLDQGRADLEDARVSSIVTEKVVGAWLRVDLQELVVEQKHVEQSVLGVHGCEFDALPLSLAPLKAGVHRLLSPSDVLRLLFCTIWLIADDVSLKALGGDLLLSVIGTDLDIGVIYVHFRIDTKV